MPLENFKRKAKPSFETSGASFAATQRHNPKRMEFTPNYLITYSNERIWTVSICEQMAPLILVPGCVKK